jgi:hypothetical protein
MSSNRRSLRKHHDTNRIHVNGGRLLLSLSSGLLVVCLISIRNQSENRTHSSIGIITQEETKSSFRGQSYVKVNALEEGSKFQICQPSASTSYVCEGPEYDAFAEKLEALLKIFEQQDSALSKPVSWGKRRNSPFPDNSTILAVGNSHTRQILQTLICQYKVLQMIDMESNTTEVSRRGSYYFTEFANHAKLHLITNNALFYSHKWRTYLQEMTGLSRIHAMIVGQINGMTEAYNTSFMDLMIEKTSHLEDADFTSVAPPQLEQFAEFYSGPIVAHSLMCYWGYDNFYGMNDFVQSFNRPNVQMVNGRAYIGMLGECSTDNWLSVGVCSTDASSHRCVGDRGGHPDLLAWDIVEALDGLLYPIKEFTPRW